MNFSEIVLIPPKRVLAQVNVIVAWVHTTYASLETRYSTMEVSIRAGKNN